MSSTARDRATIERAAESRGASNDETLYRIVSEFLSREPIHRGALADVGCGIGSLGPHVSAHVDAYLGVDIVRYGAYPRDQAFLEVDLNAAVPTFAAPSPAIVCSLETIEHVENPRALFRAMVRWLAPGGRLIVSTPNQLSWLSKLGLVVKNEFVHFQERPGLYPAHLSALLEIDLRRMARENALTDVTIRYSGNGRIPGTASHWPRWLSSRDGWRGRAFSDNILLFARKPADPSDGG